MKIQTSSRRPLLVKASGMTLIEISLVIALLLGLIAVVFLGLGNYRKGADKARCKIQLSQVQKAVRAYANFNNLDAKAPIASAFGTGLAMESEPKCPAGGAYAWLAEIPEIGTPFGNCDYSEGNITHVLTTGAGSETVDW